MADKEKVIKGLECCMSDLTCNGCPYWDEDNYCDDGDRLKRDAIDLLKAQEPIVPIKRSAHAQGADDVWYVCGKCGKLLGDNPDSIQRCPNCGRAVKWE